MVVEKTAPYPKSHPNPTRKCSRMDAPGAQKKQLMINQLSFLVTALQQPHNTQSINIPRKIIASHGLSTRKADLPHRRTTRFRAPRTRPKRT